MSVKTKVVVAAVAIVLLLATTGVWLNSRSDRERRPPPPTPEGEIARIVEPEDETPVGPSDDPAGPTGVTEGTESADTTAPEEAVGERYLTVTVLDHRGDPAPGARVFFSSAAPVVTEMLRLLREKLRVLHERVRESEDVAERAATTQEAHEVERLISEYAAPEFELALTADERGRAVFKASGAGEVRARRGSAHSYRHLLAPPASGEWSVELRLRAPDDFGPEIPTEERGRSRHTAARGGQRNLRAMGGELRTASATDLGLKWLSDHRSSEGGWEADAFSRRCECTCDGPGLPAADIAVTGLALLAFLANGQTHQHGVYKTTIREAQSRLLAWQDGAGRFTLGEPSEFVSHAIALQAMAEAWSLTGAGALKDSAERAVVFLESGISPDDCRPDELIWSACALISAKLGGLQVDDACLRSIEGRLASLVPTTAGGRFPPASSEALRCAASFCRGVLSTSRPEPQEPSLDLSSLLPRLEGEPDFGLLHFGTYAAFQEAGETWQKWNESMKAVVTDRQEQDGHERGSWAPSGPGGEALGRVGTTALATMALQVYYRYPQGLSIR